MPIVKRLLIDMPNHLPPSRNFWLNRSWAALFLVMTALLLLGAAGCTPNLGQSTKGWGSVAAADGVVYATTLNGQSTR